MVITYYADVIFAWNFVMDFFLLFLIHPDTKKRYWRLAAAATIGGVAALMMLYLSVQTPVLYFLLRFFWAAVMVAVAMPAKGLGERFCNTALLYGAGGGLYGITELIAERMEHWREKTLLLVPLSLGVVLCGKMLYRFRKKQAQRLEYQSVASMRNGAKHLECKAFYDSGNHLFEPISGKPVVLVRSRIAAKLGLNPKKLRVVPYSSLGRTTGLLEAYPLEALRVRSGSTSGQFRNIYVAVAEDTMFSQEDCEVILHSEMIPHAEHDNEATVRSNVNKYE